MRYVKAWSICTTILLVAVVVNSITPKANAVGENVLIGAGDIGDCGTGKSALTADLLDNEPGTVFAIGDNAYPDGSASNFADCYEPTWGRHKARTTPVPGNHDYRTPGASGYFGYFGAAAGNPSQGWYSYDKAGWHIVMLNSEKPMNYGSAQMLWLQADLAANPTVCSAAMWHHPRFSSGLHYPGDSSTADAFQQIYDSGVDVVVNGHEHWYERFEPVDPTGAFDPTGVREFEVGTGGRQLKSPQVGAPVHPASAIRSATSYGVLKLTLNPASYDWAFSPVAGSSFTDSGTGSCQTGLRDQPAAPAIQDTFTRSTTNSWTNADVGGAWTESNGSSFATTGTQGRIRHTTSSSGRTSYLKAVSMSTVRAETTVNANKPPSGSGQYFGVVLRSTTPGVNEYRARVRLRPGGVASVSLTRLNGGVQTTMGPETTVPGLATNQPIRLIGQVEGLNPTTISVKAYSASGTEPVNWQLTRTDATPTIQSPGAVGVFTYLGASITNLPVDMLYDDFYAAAPPPIAPIPPSASFVAACSGVHCEFDATASSDPDGEILDYIWDFGDAQTGTGATTTSDFATPGIYTVTLTVIDDSDLSSTQSQSLNVSNSAVPIVQDTFSRVTSGGWGVADTGNSWTTTHSSSLSTDGSKGRVRHTASSTGKSAYITGVSQTSLTLATTVSADKAATGSGQYLAVALRSNNPGMNEYRARVHFLANGTVGISLTRVVGGIQTVIGPETLVPGLSSSQPVRLVSQVEGTEPTTISVKAFAAADPEPALWQLVRTDSSAEIQTPGTFGIVTYLGTSTNLPVVLIYDDIIATPIPVPPVAAFTANCNGLGCDFDANASTDPDGNIVDYTWNFGDGQTGTGATTTNSFALVGTYTVTLLVTDDTNLTASIEIDVNVS